MQGTRQNRREHRDGVTKEPVSEAVALYPKDKGKPHSLQLSRRLHRAYNKMLIIQRNGRQEKSGKLQQQQSIAGNKEHCGVWEPSDPPSQKGFWATAEDLQDHHPRPALFNVFWS